MMQILIYLAIYGFVVVSSRAPVTSRYHNVNCTSEPRCKCTKVQGKTIKADCSGLQLQAIPLFYSEVGSIDLSKNRLENFSNDGKIPSSVVHLDLSDNIISDFSANAFRDLENLEFLSLRYNNLPYTSNVFKPGIFTPLKKLKFLNLQKNIDSSVPSDIHVYPTAIAEIKTIKTLALDGINNATFSQPFKKLHQLKKLTMSGISGKCYIKTLTQRSFLNTPFLRTLTLTGCNLRRVENNTFKSLIHLQHLNISHNKQLSFRALPNITHDLQFTNIKILDISKIHCTYGPGTILYTGDLIALKNSALTDIYLDSNRLAILDNDVLLNTPQTLKKISVRDNRLTMGGYIIFVKTMKRLKVFDGNFQYTSHYPSSKTNRLNICYDWRGPDHIITESGFEDEDEDVEETNELSKYEDIHSIQSYFQIAQEDTNYNLTIPLPPNLTTGWFESCNLRYSIPELTFVSDNAISHLHFRDNVLYSWEGPIYNLKKLVYADFSHNLCSYMSNNIFREFPNLEFLNVSHNYLGFVLNKTGEIDPFRSLSKLQILDLSFNRIESLSESVFRNLYKMEKLHLRSNLLSSWDFEIGHMSSLRSLDLSTNQLQFIPKRGREMIIKLARNRSFKVNLYRNRFVCDCSKTSLEFVKWISETQKRYGLFERFNEYTCTTSGFKLIHFSSLDEFIVQLERECGSHLGLIIGVLIAISISIALVIAGVVYRYRWKLRYFYYMTKSRYWGYTSVRDHGDDLKYEYDVFVSYAEEDSLFVLQNFLDAIETQRGIKACVHHRDFIAGLDIAQNITNAVHNSRKTVVILSPDYLKSHWCKTEFNMARMEGIYSRDGRNVIFLILFRSVPTKKVPLELLFLMEKQSYIEYPNDPDHGDLAFWESVATAIRQ